ncbi:MAG: UDP-N-acetylmuramoyl-tripeptide--D-alanyl-D-alanine ligase [Halobacteriovoraceae bacterium]|nr:UDP-N-acetylmuramoyl-tripeptide--D-alanyl-D-alanine ligase [Halobacteriovoraceae bacterium]
MVEYQTFIEAKEEILEFYNKRGLKQSFEICTDSRKYKRGQCFIAIKGDNFDGIQFLEEIIQQNCPLFICQMSDEAIEQVEKYSISHSSTQFIIVKNSVKYIQDLATLHRQKWSGEIIALTGSNGKTTTKEMLFHFMNGLFPGKVIATQGNLNNHLGVPFTLFRIQNETKYVILEMGTNHPGEIKVLCDIAVPNHGTITNIGESHLEFFKTKENVLIEKSELFHAIMKNGDGKFVLNCEDPLLISLEKKYPGKKLIKFQNDENYLVQKNSNYAFQIRAEVVDLKNDHLVGRHNFLNLAQSYLLVHSLFPKEKNKLQKLISTFKPTLGRSVFQEKKGIIFFSDAYNANPSSMRASLRGFKEYLIQKSISEDKALYIIGDMNELGDLAPELHKEIGAFVKSLGVLNPIFVGRYSKYLMDGYKDNLCIVYESKEELEQNLSNLLIGKDHVFLKASRSLQLESIIDIT